MAIPRIPLSALILTLVCSLALAERPALAFEAPSAGAVSAFDQYAGRLSSHVSDPHQPELLSSIDASSISRLRQGELLIDKLTPVGETTPGALLHHWRGRAFVAGAKLEDFTRLLRNFDAYPKIFAPQVERAAVLARQGDRMQASMRVRQKHVITVVMDTTYDVSFGRASQTQAYSISRSTHVAEISSPGTASERALSEEEGHGFIWRLNTYWSYEERDGGLYLQIESISLTRAVPRGLGWAVGPFVESIPRESLEFTLHSVCNAMRH